MLAVEINVIRLLIDKDRCFTQGIHKAITLHVTWNAEYYLAAYRRLRQLILATAHVKSLPPSIVLSYNTPSGALSPFSE